MAETRCPVCLGQKQIFGLGLMGHIDCKNCNKKGVITIEAKPLTKIEQTPKLVEDFIDSLDEKKEEPEIIIDKEAEKKEIEEKPKKIKAKKSFLKKGG